MVKLKMIYNGFDGNKVNVQRTDHPSTPSAPLRPLQSIPSPQPRQLMHSLGENRAAERERQNDVIQKWEAQHEAFASKAAKATSKSVKHLAKAPLTPQPKPSPARVKSEPPSTPPVKRKPPPTPISRLKAKRLLKAEPINKSLEVGCPDYRRAMKDATTWNKRMLKSRRTRVPYFDVHTGTAHHNSHLYRSRQMRLPRTEEAKAGAARDYLVHYEGRRWRSSKVGFEFYQSLPASWLRFSVDATKPKPVASGITAHHAFRDSSNDGFPSLSTLPTNGSTGNVKLEIYIMLLSYVGKFIFNCPKKGLKIVASELTLIK